MWKRRHWIPKKDSKYTEDAYMQEFRCALDGRLLPRMLHRLYDRRGEGDRVLALRDDIRDAERAAVGPDVRPGAAKHVVVVRRRAVWQGERA